MFSFVRNLQEIVSQSEFTSLHFHQQLPHMFIMWVSLQLQPCWWHEWYFTTALIFISLVTKNVEACFICLVATCIASFVKCSYVLLIIKIVLSLKGSVWEAPPWSGIWLPYQVYFIVVLLLLNSQTPMSDCLDLSPLVTGCLHFLCLWPCELLAAGALPHFALRGHCLEFCFHPATSSWWPCPSELLCLPLGDHLTVPALACPALPHLLAPLPEPGFRKWPLWEVCGFKGIDSAPFNSSC